MRRGSVRLRAAVGATVVVAVALVLTGVAVVFTLRAGLADNTRLRAESAAREVAAQVTDVRASGVSRVDGLDVDEPVQVVDGRGRVLGSSAPGGSFADFSPAEEKPDPPETARPPGDGGDDDGDAGGDAGGDDDGDDADDGGDDGPTTTAPAPEPVEVDRNSRSEVLALSVDEDGEFARGSEATSRQDFQVVAVHAVTRDGTPVSVYAGASLAGQEEAVSSVTRAMLVGLPVVLAVVGAVTWLVVRRALRPVEGIRRGMADITASTDLSRRVPEPDARDEVAALARTTNETLGALESAVERQRRFVADASHELRSPIASLRTQLEVGAHHPDLLDLDGAVQDTVRLQSLAADLLLLARLDAGEQPGTGRVDLAEVVRDELRQRVARVPVRLDVPEGADTTATGSRTQLGRVVGNLLDNAQRHASAGVRVSVRPGVVEVADDGSGVPSGERERIFARFVRLDDARSRDDGGAGLGLAIARDVAERHGGTLTVTDAPGGGALFTLRLPC
ncbi:HAMP domain-containing sensor histidine kinase [Streptomyces sp. DSM 42041]|uniref:histidine kinase n=1 Tax=Streptomyces hazeniae TaxID=3075538 RepID=A0ABU2NUZ5_9ACTN|nr:HAMP domain-containing sensor histidine kinase [Streptomyces sp. DSM 42041]MDT0380803.1 HAMP domain-containing sensor histidine kinase [Streptomyces sp. DSM 42041]